tara:strand:+ start:4335 stop:4550 length:216 start_codon:yes stop_codon:yes gene_type:complete
MKYLNEKAYQEVLERIRMPLFQIKLHLEDRGLSEHVDFKPHVEEIENFLQEIGNESEVWEITEDTSVWGTK